MGWIYYAGLSVVGSVLFNILLKLSQGKISGFAGVFFIQFFALLVIFMLFPILKISFLEGVTTKGIIYTALAGSIIGLTNFSIILMFHLGAPLNIAVPTTKVLAIILAVLAGTILFREQLSLTNFTGLILSITGVWLLLN